MPAQYLGALPHHGRVACWPVTRRPVFHWPAVRDDELVGHGHSNAERQAVLAGAGCVYSLNRCHDDRPTRMCKRLGQGLWAVPCPKELNGIPMIVARQMDARDFAQMNIASTDEMPELACTQPLVQGIALHPYLSWVSPAACATCVARCNVCVPGVIGSGCGSPHPVPSAGM
jgi:hypothetical protein